MSFSRGGLGSGALARSLRLLAGVALVGATVLVSVGAGAVTSTTSATVTGMIGFPDHVTPVVGATVTYTCTSCTPHVSMTTTSGTGGVYTITDLPAGTYSFDVIPPAGLHLLAFHFPAVQSLVSGENHISIFLASGSILNGTVNGPSGPLAGATVTLTCETCNPAVTIPSVQTNGSGAYTFIDLKSAIYSIEATAPGMRPGFTSVGVPFQATATAPLITLTPQTGSLTGTVTGPGGPVSGATVTATCTSCAAAASATAAIPLQETTDPNGVYTFPSLPTGTYTVMVQPPGVGLASQTRTNVNVGTGTNTQDFQLSPPQPTGVKAQLLAIATSLSSQQDNPHAQKAGLILSKLNDPKLWLSNDTLTPRGQQVFDILNQAVKELLHAGANTNGAVVAMTSKPANPAVLTLVDLARQLAANQIALASANGGKAGELTAAARAMAAGMKALGKHEYHPAIAHFKHAWEHAEHAVNDKGQP